jgi:anti-anti-sigma factor
MQTAIVRSTAADGEERLRIEGAFDALTVDAISPALEAVAARQAHRVTVDLEKVSMLDSRGVGAIVLLSKRVKARGGSVVVVRAHGQPLLVLKVLKLECALGMTAERPRSS